MIRYLFAGALALGAPSAVVAQASSQTREPEPRPSIALGEVGGWSLFDNADNCAIMTEFESGSWLRVSYDYGRNRANLNIMNAAWRSIEHHSIYRVSVYFNNGSEYGPFDATGINAPGGDVSGPIRGLMMGFNANDFLEDFAAAASVGVLMGQTRLGAFRLDGTSVAVERLRRCAFETYRRNPPDPFATVTPERR